MTKRRIIIGLLLLGGIIGGIYAFNEYNRKNRPITELASAYTINAQHIIKEYGENDSVANEKFLGKIITVMGIVKSIDKQNYTLILGDSSLSASVRCSMDSIGFADIGSLQVGSFTKIKGNCTGYNEDDLLGSDVILNPCIVVKNQ